MTILQDVEKGLESVAKEAVENDPNISRELERNRAVTLSAYATYNVQPVDL